MPLTPEKIMAIKEADAHGYAVALVYGSEIHPDPHIDTGAVLYKPYEGLFIGDSLKVAILGSIAVTSARFPDLITGVRDRLDREENEIEIALNAGQLNVYGFLDWIDEQSLETRIFGITPAGLRVYQDARNLIAERISRDRVRPETAMFYKRLYQL